MTTEAITMDSLSEEKAGHPDLIEIQSFGFWIYLMSDLILFAAIFATFAVVGHNYAGGPTGKDLFDLPYLFAETLLLLLSSATCGFSVLAMRDGRSGRVMLWLVFTFLLGLGFVCMELAEFHSMIIEGAGPARSAFLSSFFTLVGTHGAHVACGLIWIAVMTVQVAVKGLTVANQSRLIRWSMFWHFLDIVWIGVFTFVYLLGVL